MGSASPRGSVAGGEIGARGEAVVAAGTAVSIELQVGLAAV